MLCAIWNGLQMTPDVNLDFEALLEYLKHTRGIDFTGYKRSSLMRRVNKRMQIVEIETYSNYQDYLEVHPEEFLHLFNTLLINVTSFFRDSPAWDYIRSQVLPQILLRKAANEPIRVWSAGCSSGEEACTLAMLLAELLGVEQFRKRVKIYATDIDEDALNQARLATYESRAIENISEDYLSKYFERVEDRFVFNRDVRRSIVFGRHDLVQDAPISRVDLLVCRNALMYFNAETQVKIVNRFNFALVEGGFLFLGKAETLLSQNSSFVPIDLKQRVFAKAESGLRDRLLLATSSENTEALNPLSSQIRIREAAFDVIPIAQVVVNVNGAVVLVNERARNLFNLNRRDVGRLLQDLELSYYPVELRSLLRQAYTERRSLTLRNIEWTMGDALLSLEVQVSPLMDANGALLGASITFTDMSRYIQLQQDLENSNQELEMAYQELQSANEELETTNEELQSTVEELETTNEELQSTNEELETMNEELQSTNEELYTINEELRGRSIEVIQLNAFLESIFTSLRSGVVVLDSNLSVQIWNQEAEELWGLRSGEARDQHFLSLDINLPVSQLHQSIRNCLNQGAELEEILLEAVNRRGKAIQCKVTCSPLLGAERETRGVILLMEQMGAPSDGSVVKQE